MKQKTQQEDLMIRYLLGDLAEAEQRQIEERFLADNRYFEQLCSVEDALIDEYARGRLAEPERAKVESLLRSSRRQARELEFTQDLIKYVSPNPAAEMAPTPRDKKHSAGAWLNIGRLRQGGAFAAAAILIAAIAGLIVWNLALQKRVRQMQALQAGLEEQHEELQQQIARQKDQREASAKELDDERQKREQLEAELAALQESQSPPSNHLLAIFDLTAAPFTRGDGELPVAQIPPNTSRFQIRIRLDSNINYKTYRAVIKTVEEREIWSGTESRHRQTNPPRLVFTLPASLLANNDYILTLTGKTETGELATIRDYPFRVKK